MALMTGLRYPERLGGLVLLVDAISQAPQYGWGATRTIAVLAASVSLLVRPG